ncbi:MAG: adenosylcobinamide-GDP ribazoletransferase [Gammaproteobacteria bacterium HGW-Gammaproteobacteria-10]|nr:MAG: adenosylcobinamide-GDP ribazoletransferase [Gammaproteobacteria bacterium HGW-Gammaproteobacteria-10]
MPSLHDFLLAVGFYTRLPCPATLDYQRLPKSCVYLPLVGWLVGGISASVFWIALQIWPQDIAVVIALIAGILVTGAFHEDGFADVCDGFGGGYDKQHILDIMKDSQIGAYGALGLLLLLLLKFRLLTGLPAHLPPLALLAGHSISRWFPLYLMYRYDYARTQPSKSSGAVFKPDAKTLLLAGIPALLPFVLLPPLALTALIPMALVTLVLGRYFHRHIGGYTGDCLGAGQQVAEVVFYLFLNALWTFI